MIKYIDKKDLKRTEEKKRILLTEAYELISSLRLIARYCYFLCNSDDYAWVRSDLYKIIRKLFQQIGDETLIIDFSERE